MTLEEYGHHELFLQMGVVLYHLEHYLLEGRLQAKQMLVVLNCGADQYHQM